MYILLAFVIMGAVSLLLYLSDVASNYLGQRSREIQDAGLDKKTYAQRTASKIEKFIKNPIVSYLWIPNRIREFDKIAKQIGIKFYGFGKKIYSLIGVLIFMFLLRVISSTIRNGMEIRSIIFNSALIVLAIALPDILIKLAAKDHKEKLVEGLSDVLELIFANTSTGFSSREILDAVVNTLYESPIKRLLTELNNGLKLNTPYEQAFRRYEEKVSDERLINFGIILREALENDNNISDYTRRESEMIKEIKRQSMQKKHSRRLLMLTLNGGIAVLTFMFIITVPFILRTLSIFIEIGG